MSDMSNSDARKRAGQVTTFTDPYAGTRKPDEQTTPRVARSIDDLRVGQMVVVSLSRGNSHRMGTVQDIGAGGALLHLEGTPDTSASAFGFTIGQWVILADPPAPPVADWLVPGEAIEALREIAEQGYVQFDPHELYRRSRALLDAATPKGSDDA